MPDRIKEFHNIAPIDNLASILKLGLLSHFRASRLTHTDVSMNEVQKKRAKVKIPNGLRLHYYANVYFHARNPMLYSLQGKYDKLCILRISKSILQIPNIIITDGNASSNYVRFLPISSINMLELDSIFAEDWTHSNRSTYYKRKFQKCAEVLIPHNITPEYIVGIYVVSETVQKEVAIIAPSLPIEVKPHLFFQ